MLMNGDIQRVFLINTYRNNEVSSSHPLMLILDKIKKNNSNIEQIFISPLELDSINELIADTLKSNPINVKPLAELILLKTGGNPFFVREFLASLYQENLLNFDNNQRQWCWDLTIISQCKFTD